MKANYHHARALAGGSVTIRLCWFAALMPAPAADGFR